MLIERLIGAWRRSAQRVSRADRLSSLPGPRGQMARRPMTNQALPSKAPRTSSPPGGSEGRWRR